jgi:4-hydroxybenzoate polyprenyltransferase
MSPLPEPARAPIPELARQATSIADEPTRPIRPRLSSLLSCIRYREVLVLQGPPLMGLAFSIGTITPGRLPAAALFAVASFLLVAHVWSFNDWAGLASDRNDPNRAGSVFSARGVSPRDILLLSLGLLALSLLGFSVLSRLTLTFAAAIASLGVLYSHPSINAKGIPLMSSSPHLIGGLLHFLLGYSLFGGVDRRGILIALFFALTFTAGHLNQEVRDYESDRGNGLRTNAVAFGRRPAFLAGLAIFTLAYGDLFFLAYAGLVAPALGALPLALYPIHLAWSLIVLREGLTFERVRRFQSGYRALYAAIGFAMVAALLLR